MGVQAGVTKEGSSLLFTGSITTEGTPFGVGQQGGTFDVRWNATDKRIEKSADGGATWATVLEFDVYSV